MTKPLTVGTTEFNKLHKRMRRNVGRAIEDYRMIDAYSGDGEHRFRSIGIT